MFSQNSKNKALLVFASALSLFLITGCGISGKAKLPPEAKNPNVVAVFGGEVLTLEEFENRYTRSVGDRTVAENDSLLEYQDFLERYVNFRLKVRAAEAAGVSTSPEVSDEIRTYRANLARPYLLENEVVEPIVKQLYLRQKQLNDVSHILIRVDQHAVPADTLKAFQRASALRDSVIQGMDFGEVAFYHSEDPSSRGSEARLGYKGRLGYFSAGRMIEPFETFSYETPVGEISPVFRTQFGYHFLLVHDRRDAPLEIQLSHVMVRSARGDSAAAWDTLRVVQQRLQRGEDFAELAKEYSHDVQSAPRGGDIGYISFDAPIDESFKNPAFALGEVGEVSDIVQTAYGLHLIKLTGRKAPRTLEESYDDLKQVASRLPRTEAAQRDLARDVIARRQARVDTALVLAAFENVPADSVFSRLIQKRLPEEVLSNTIFEIGDSTYTFRDLADFAGTASLDRLGDTEYRVMTTLSKFLTERTIENEAARLEERDPEFRRIMHEFRDGLVLFQFMEDSVWTAADRDSVALKSYFEAHAGQYRWPERTRIISLQAPSDSLARVFSERLDSGEAAHDIYASYADDSLRTVRIDTMMVADRTNSIYDRALELQTGEHSEPLRHRNAYLILVNDGREAPRQKTFEEARTQVVSDYQVVLEERLVNRLRERYNAHTFPDRLVNAYETSPGVAQATASGG